MSKIQWNRRAIAAAISGAAASAVVVFRRNDEADDVEARRRRGKPRIEGPCGSKPTDNKCKRNNECCTGFCDRDTGRCRYKALGEPCSSDIQCRGDRQCLDGVCALPGTATVGPTTTPTVSPTASATNTPIATATNTPAPTSTPSVQPSWNNLTTFGSGPAAGSSNFDSPSGVALTSDGRTMLISDRDNHRVSVWTRSTNASTDWSNVTTFGSQGSGNTQFYQPYGLVLTPDDLSVLIADKGNSRIVIWSRSSTSASDWSYLAQFGSIGSGASSFTDPLNVDISANGLDAYVSDNLNNRVSVWNRPNTSSSSWSNLTTFGGSLSYPNGGRLSSDGLNFYVAEISAARVSMWSRPNTSSTSWAQVTSFGSAGSGSSQFQSPYAVFPTTDNMALYVVDCGNSRISVWIRPNTSSTSWSNVLTFGTLGSTTSNLSFPYNAINYNAKVYIADTNNDRISIWQPPA